MTVTACDEMPCIGLISAPVVLGMTPIRSLIPRRNAIAGFSNASAIDTRAIELIKSSRASARPATGRLGALGPTTRTVDHARCPRRDALILLMLMHKAAGKAPRDWQLWPFLQRESSIAGMRITHGLCGCVDDLAAGVPRSGSAGHTYCCSRCAGVHTVGGVAPDRRLGTRRGYRSVGTPPRRGSVDARWLCRTAPRGDGDRLLVEDVRVTGWHVQIRPRIALDPPPPEPLHPTDRTGKPPQPRPVSTQHGLRSVSDPQRRQLPTQRPRPGPSPYRCHNRRLNQPNQPAGGQFSTVVNSFGRRNTMAGSG